METKTRTCRSCGCAEHYTCDARFAGDAHAALPTSAFWGSDCRLRVCGGCGLAEWFLTPASLNKAKEKFTRES